MNALIVILLFCFSYGCLQAQSINGIVLDNETADTLELVHIYNLNKNSGNLTTAQGKFSLNASPGDTLIFQYVGYDQFLLKIKEDAIMNEVIIKLKKGNRLLPEITIFADRLNLIEVEKPQRMEIPGLPYIENPIPIEPMSLKLGNSHTTDKDVKTLPVIMIHTTLHGSISYFNKREKEKRKMKKVVRMGPDKIYILRDHEIMAELASAFKLETNQLNEQIAKFSKDHGQMLASLNEEEIVGQFILFLSERKEKKD